METGWAIKQLAEAGVRIFSYLDGREIVLDTPIDRFVVQVLNFASDQERHNAQQRVTDTMTRKAKAGHVTEGLPFGYKGFVVLGPTGKRSHVEWRIDDTAAPVVRRIFHMAAAGT